MLFMCHKIDCFFAILLICFCNNAIGQTTILYDTVTFKGMPTQLVMAPVKGGYFTMGSKNDEWGRAANEGPQKNVGISDFYIGAFEITWEQYNAFFQDEALTVNSDVDAVTRPSTPYLDFTLGMGKNGYPANSMQQYGALMFCKWLYKNTGVFYRLPTEAEWEYACRAGTTTPYFFGNDTAALGEYAWYAGNSNGKYQLVGTRKPNAWGLYDMLGNVAEWTMDPYEADYFEKLADATMNPLTLPKRRHPRTVKGGSYKDEAAMLRPASRIASDPVWNRRDPQIPKSKWWNADAPFVGFRVVRPVNQPTAVEIETFFNQFLFK